MAKAVLLVFLMAVLLAAALVLPRFVAGRVTSLAPEPAAAVPNESQEAGALLQPPALPAINEPAGADNSAGSITAEQTPEAAPLPQTSDASKYENVVRLFFASLAQREFKQARKFIEENRAALGDELAANMLGALTVTESENQRMEQFLSATKATMETNNLELRKALEILKEITASKAPAEPK